METKDGGHVHLNQLELVCEGERGTRSKIQVLAQIELYELCTTTVGELCACRVCQPVSVEFGRLGVE